MTKWASKNEQAKQLASVGAYIAIQKSNVNDITEHIFSTNHCPIEIARIATMVIDINHTQRQVVY